MSTFKQGAPRVIHEGIRDLSGRVVVQPTPVEPTHVPIIFLLSAKQRKEPLFMFPSQIEQLLGGETIERGSKYFSHQTQLLEIIAANANPFLFYPVTLPEAKHAFIRLSVAVTDLHPDMGAGYDGEAPVTRYRLTWMNGVDSYPAEYQGFGDAQPFEIAEGTMVYPVLETRIEHAGEYGNSFGFQITQVDSKIAPQGATKSTTMAYNLAIIERTKSGNQRIVKTVYGEDTIAFTIDPEATDRLGRPMALRNTFEMNYGLTVGSTYQNYGEFDEINLYTNHIETVLEMLVVEESKYDHLIPTTLASKWKLEGDLSRGYYLNIFTGKMFDGETNYSSFTVDKALLMGKGNVAYAKYGDDGIPTEKNARARFNRANAILDAFVYDLKDDIASNHSYLHNYDRWDFSVAYDTGFAPDAKDSLIELLAARKDVSLFLTPMSYGQLEIVPEIEVVQHDAYMRGVNNFQAIPFSREGMVEVKGLITELLEDRQVGNFTFFVDGTDTPYIDFVIDDKGYWSAKVEASAFGSEGYVGQTQFTAEVSVIDHPEIPSQKVTSTKMEYQLAPAKFPVPTVTQVWGGNSVPYSKAAGEYQGTLGALVGTITSEDGPLTDLFEVLSAKFTYGNAKEKIITNDFVIWDEVYTTPLRKDFLKSYDKTGTAKLIIQVRDRLSLETKTIESVPFAYNIAFPILNPVITVTEINGGKPVIPNYTDLNAPLVNVKGTVTGLGVDDLLALDRMLLKVAGVTVSNSSVSYTLNEDHTAATWEANVQRGYFPVLPSNDQHIDITAPGTGVVGESYHAQVDVDAIANYRQLHLSNAILPIEDDLAVYVSDIVSLTMDWDAVVDYSEASVTNPNNGIILVDNIPVVNGIENVGFLMNGSFYDYQEIVSAKATIGTSVYDLKVLNNYTLGAARIRSSDMYPNYIRNGNIGLELTVKHRSGHNVKLNLAQAYSVRYPALPALTTKVTTINGNNTVWFDETWNNPNKTVPVTGEIVGLHNLRRQKNIQLSVDNVVREDVTINVDRETGVWNANLPAKYLNLSSGGQAQLNLVLTYLPDNVDVVAVATPRSYTVNKLTLPTMVVERINDGLAVSWENAQIPGSTTEIQIGGYVSGVATDIDPTIFTMQSGTLVINGLTIPAGSINWGMRMIGGINKIVAIVPSNLMIFQDRPFAASGTLNATIGLVTTHNGRPYSLATATVPYAIDPKLGVVAVSVDSYNAGVEIDPLNTPTAVYTLRGEVSGMAPYQSVDSMQFMFQNTAVTPTSLSLGTAVTDEGGFITRPYTATFLGTSHLDGLILADLTGYVDNQATGGSLTDPTMGQGDFNFGNSSSGWNTTGTGSFNSAAYKGIIESRAVIANSVTESNSTVASFTDLEYTVTPKRALSITLGDLVPTLLDPLTEVVANQVRKVLNFEFAMMRTDYEEISAIEVLVGGVSVNASDITYHRRDQELGLGQGRYQKQTVELSIPNKYIVNNGEYLEMSTPAYENAESAVGLYKAGMTLKVTVRNKATGTTRVYNATSTLFSRAYYGVRALAEIVTINNGNTINRWADPDTLIPVQFRVRDLYKRAMDHTPTEYNFTVDGRVLTPVTIVDETYSASPYYNSLSTMTANATVKLSDMIELMSVWANADRTAPFNGTLALTPKVTAENGSLTSLAKVTKVFTAVEVLPASTSIMNVMPVNNGSTVILNSLSTYPIEVKAVVQELRPIWGEVVTPESVIFKINGAVVPPADYNVTVTPGAVDAQGKLDSIVSITTSRQVYARYFADQYLPIDEVALEGGVPVTGTVEVTTPITSNYGTRATLVDAEQFLAGHAVEGPEDDVTVGATDANSVLVTEVGGFQVVDLMTGEVLAEGDTVDELRASADAGGEIEIEALGAPKPAG